MEATEGSTMDNNGAAPRGITVSATAMQWFIFLLLLVHIVVTQWQFEKFYNKLDTLQLALVSIERSSK